jgi:hypothetical protein
VATYIELQTDSFKDIRDDLASSRDNFDFLNVRRPYRGIEIKEDTYAIIKVIRSNGTEIALTDAGARNTATGASIRAVGKEKEIPPEGSTFNYSNFIAQRIIEARSEKSQVVETFGEPFIFFYGEKPRILNVQGLLMNTLDFNWKNEFWRNYETYLRGTKLVEHNARMYLYYDDQIVEGYLLDANAQLDANLPYHVPFSFTLFVTAHTYLGMIESSGLYPVSANIQVPAEDLQQTKNVEDVVRRLRDQANSLRPAELISTVEEVRWQSELAAAGITGKDAIMGAVIRGLSDYEAKTIAFFDNIKTYFYGRRTVVPKGFAGAEDYVGPAQYANEAISPGEPPLRTQPIRSKISDNVDEYVGGWPAAMSSGLIEEALQEDMSLTDAEYELLLLSELATMGVDISDPSPMQQLRGTLTNTIVEVGGKIDFAAGIARGTVGAIKSKTNQIAQVASSLPGIP